MTLREPRLNRRAWGSQLPQGRWGAPERWAQTVQASVLLQLVILEPVQLSSNPGSTTVTKPAALPLQAHFLTCPGPVVRVPGVTSVSLECPPSAF